MNETESMLFEYALRESTDAGILEPSEERRNPNPNEENRYIMIITLNTDLGGFNTYIVFKTRLVAA